MKRWQVTFALSSSVSISVEARTEEKARQKAWREVGTPTICHQCSETVNLGEPYEIIEIEEEEGV